MYADGDGIARDHVQALALLDLACQNKYMPTATARARRAELERTMTEAERGEALRVRQEIEARIASSG